MTAPVIFLTSCRHHAYRWPSRVFCDHSTRLPYTSPSASRSAVYGNSAYPRARLANPVHDATDFADYLRRQLRFTVYMARDANQYGMEAAFERLLSHIQPGSVVILSFHGHACEVDAVNYLMPILRGSSMSNADIKHRAVSAQWMLEKVWEKQPAFVLFILDACREDPYRGTRTAGGGLAAMDPLGSLLLYACAPKCVAQL